MSVDVMFKATKALVDQGYDCHADVSANDSRAFTVFDSPILIISFNNFVDHNQEQFIERLELLAEHGIRGEMLWQLMQR